MKLTAPTFIIDEAEPFKNDQLGRDAFANILLNLVGKVEEHLVISLNAPWGEGKTTFIKMWQGLLKKQNIHSIYFDAFENDYFNEPFLALVSEINSFIESLPKKHPARKLSKDFKEKAARVGGQLLNVGARTAIKAATIGFIKDTEIEELKGVWQEISQGSTELVTQYIKTKLDNYKNDKATIHSFKKQFQQLAVEIKQESQHPLVIIIDELDRCKPTYALELIEEIKHFFAVDNAIFLLVMHKAQLEEMIRCVYGANVDASTYLQKFIHIECQLPKNKDEHLRDDYESYCRFLTKTHELTDWEHRNRFQETIVAFARHFDLSLRDLERCYTNLTIFYASIAEGHLTIALLIGFLTVVKIKHQPLYQGLKEKRLTVDDISAKLNLNKNGPLWQNLISWLKYCLLSEEQFNALDVNDKARSLSNSHARYPIERTKIIPYLCSHMDLFEVST